MIGNPALAEITETIHRAGVVETVITPRPRGRGYLVTIISYDPYRHQVGTPRPCVTLPEAMEYEAKVLDLLG